MSPHPALKRNFGDDLNSDNGLKPNHLPLFAFSSSFAILANKIFLTPSPSVTHKTVLHPMCIQARMIR
jgi:hypothetical protein